MITQLGMRAVQGWLKKNGIEFLGLDDAGEGAQSEAVALLQRVAPVWNALYGIVMPDAESEIVATALKEAGLDWLSIDQIDAIINMAQSENFQGNLGQFVLKHGARLLFTRDSEGSLLPGADCPHCEEVNFGPTTHCRHCGGIM